MNSGHAESFEHALHERQIHPADELAMGPRQRNPEQHRRFRVVAFALLTPFFFCKAGLNVSLAHSLPRYRS